MSVQISKKLRKTTSDLIYWCQGCKQSHSVRIEGQHAWTFDGNFESPTFSPSVLTTSGHYISGHKPGDRCWCTYNAENPDNPAPFTCQRCHTFIKNGNVQFLNDCSHELAGQILPLPDLPDYLQGE